MFYQLCYVDEPDVQRLVHENDGQVSYCDCWHRSVLHPVLVCCSRCPRIFLFSIFEKTCSKKRAGFCSIWYRTGITVGIPSELFIYDRNQSICEGISPSFYCVLLCQLDAFCHHFNKVLMYVCTWKHHRAYRLQLTLKPAPLDWPV